MASGYCPDCEERIVINPTPAVGKKLICPHCGVELEIVGTDPLEFDWAYDEPDMSWDDEEDW